MRYVELHCKSNYSFLEGASHAEELFLRAVELGYDSLAISDRDTLAGVVRAHAAAKQTGLKLIVAAELHPADCLPVVVWVTDRAAYGRLARLITLGRRRSLKGACHLELRDLAADTTGWIAGILPCRGAAPAALNDGSGLDAVEPPSPEAIRAIADHFPGRCYLLTELHREADDARWLQELLRLSTRTNVPLAAAGNVHYHVPARQPLHDLLTAIRWGVTVEQVGQARFQNAQRYLRSKEEIAQLFAPIPEAVRATLDIAEQCRFSLDELRYEYPVELAPQGQAPLEYLSRLTWDGARERYPSGVPERVRQLLEHELALIAELHYEAYFLTVWDLVRFARSRGILCQGRGSAANSSVCFCLGVTSVDPDRTDVLFERFVSRERNEAPDIDVDFEHERREEVLQYIYEKYGRERAGMTAVVTTYRSRSAIRDVGKALGLSLDRVDALAKMVEGYEYEPRLAERCRQVGVDPDSTTGRRLVHLVNELIGFPRHLSQHVGGMVITNGPLCELAPIENAAMPGRTVIEWDKDDLDELGILKVDCLSLGMLTAIRKCFALVEQHYGRVLTLASIPEGDPAVYDMISRADTMGVFQIESRAQMSMLPRLKPRCFYDLVIEVAIVRPGPIQGQMVHPYLRRRSGEESVEYPNEQIRTVLEKTLGVPIFQEQAMRLAVVAAGFTPGEADQLRRAMGAWRRPGVIEQFRVKLIEGMAARGLSQEFAERLFQQIRGFGEYGFPESHAASFALLVYVSAWLKYYFHGAFTAAIINSQPMGFYAPAQLVRDAREHGVEVRAVDVNFSEWDCTLEPAMPHADNERPSHEPARALRLGMRLIGGLPREDVESLVRERARGPFRSPDDLRRRLSLRADTIARLSDADAFGSVARDRRQSLWSALAPADAGRKQSLFANIDDDEPLVELPAMALDEQVLADYRSHGLSLRAHPLTFYRAELTQMAVLDAQSLARKPPGSQVRVAGLVLLRQRPGTAKGITFVTLEDETGIANLIVRQAVWDRFYEVARRAPAWIAEGRLESKDSVVHVVVERLFDLSKRLGELRTKSRDFR